MLKKSKEDLDLELVFDDAQINVTHNAALMTSSLNDGKLKEALKYASGLIKELGNPLLTVKYYYIICKF